VDVVVALLPSPLLGPAVWRPVATRMAQDGWRVVIAAATRVGTPEAVLRSFLDALPEDRRLVLVPHSNAGLYVPALTAARDVHGYVFVDAGLPASGGRVGLAPPALLDQLGGMADDDGMLPSWTGWWDEAAVAGLFPDATVRDEVEREQRQLPLSYFADTLPVPSGWDSRPGAYLAFGDTYLPQRQAAAERGWPVSTLAGGHLHMLHDPRRVATAIGDLLRAIGPG
jgi:hypothetical protein